MRVRTEFLVGVDLGQCRDFTAIAVIGRAELKGARDPATWAYKNESVLQLRHLERVPLGTPYPEVVERVVSVTRSGALLGRCQIVVDGTGVGRPVVDLLRGAPTGCTVWPAMLTGGDSETSGGGYYRIPKRELIIGLQVLLQSGKLQIAGGLKFGPALVAEMAAMQVKISAAGNELFGAWREGTHDDMVFAVALACWGAKRIWG